MKTHSFLVCGKVGVIFMIREGLILGPLEVCKYPLGCHKGIHRWRLHELAQESGMVSNVRAGHACRPQKGADNPQIILSNDPLRFILSGSDLQVHKSLKLSL